MPDVTVGKSNSKARQRLSGLGYTGHRRSLLDTLVPILVDHPFEHLTLVSVARISGISLWVLRGAFGNARNLLFFATAHAIENVLSELEYAGRNGESVMEAISSYVDFLAGRMQTEGYRNLLLLMIRYGTTVTWVAEAYNERIIARICRDLEIAVFDAGQRRGETILLREGAAKRLYKQIEAAVALPSLLPEMIELTPDQNKEKFGEIARAAFSATFAFEWDASRARHAR